MQPIDYTSAFGQNPMGGFVNALQAGQQFGLVEQQRQAAAQQQQMLQQQQQAASLRQQQIADAMGRLMAKPNRTFQDYEQVATLLPKEAADGLRANFEALTKEQQRNRLQSGAQVWSAVKSGQTDVALKLLGDYAEGERNAGRDDIAKAYETWSTLIKANPSGADLVIGGEIAALPGGKDFIESAGKIQDQRRQEALGPAALEAERRKGIPSSILEAIEYEKLTPSQQQIFRNTQTLRQPVTRVEISNIEKGSAAELAKLVPDLYTQANAAAGQVADLPRYRQQLQSAITGPLADQRLAVARVASALGFAGDKAITATTELIQGNADMALKARGLLTGQGQITEFEQKLLIKAKTADINFTKPELEALFNVFERAARAQYGTSRRLLESAAKKSETAQMFLDNVTALPTPAAQAPAGDVRSRADAIISGVQ